MVSAITGRSPMPIADGARVLTPDDVMDGERPLRRGQRVMVWDDDHYYMGGLMAEVLAGMGCETHYLTPACGGFHLDPQLPWSSTSIQTRLLEKGVKDPSPSPTWKRSRSAGSPHRARSPVAHRGGRDGRGRAGHPRARPRIASGARSSRRVPRSGPTRESSRWPRSGTPSRRPPSPTRCTPGRRYAEELDGGEATGDDGSVQSGKSWSCYPLT